MMKYLVWISVCFLMISCSKIADKEYSNILKFDPVKSSIKTPFFRDSIIVKYYSNDSIVVKLYDGASYIESLYFNSNNEFFEKRVVTDLAAGYLGVDTILTFSKYDTTFVYKTQRDKFIVTLIDLSLFDCLYKIKKEGDGFVSSKKSIIDSTYEEMFFYDSKYHIYKYINTWKGKRCVYDLQ